MLVLALGVAALADDSCIHGFFRYTVEEQSVTITAYTGKEEEVTVPAMIGGNPVNTIAAGAFANNGYVKTVYLPDTIMTVEEGAFSEGQKAVFGTKDLQPGQQPDPTSDGQVQGGSAGGGTPVGGGSAPVSGGGGGGSAPGGATAPAQKPETTTPFVDVNDDDYFADAVKWALENGITKGTDETHFSPNAACTRGQMVTFLWRAAGKPEPRSSENRFADIDANAYYYKAVLWAAEQGITQGTGSDTFSPDATVTRAQTVTFLYRALGGGKADGNQFKDVGEDTYYYDAVLWAAENGITQGTGKGTFSPEADCLRGQIVTFLYRAYA